VVFIKWTLDLVTILVQLQTGIVKALGSIVQPTVQPTLQIVKFLGFFESLVQCSSTFCCFGEDLFPSILNTYQAVFDEDHVLLLTNLSQMYSFFTQAEQHFTLNS